MTDFPLHHSTTHGLDGSLRVVLSRSLSSIAQIARLCGRSFSGMPSSMVEAQMLLYCDPYGLRGKKRPEKTQSY